MPKAEAMRERKRGGRPAAEARGRTGEDSTSTRARTKTEKLTPRRELKLGWLMPRHWKDVFRGLELGSLMILLAIVLVMWMAYPCSIIAAIAVSLNVGGLVSLGGGWLMVLVLWWFVAPFMAGLAAGDLTSGAWAGLFTCLIFPTAVIFIFILTGGGFVGSISNLAVNGLVGVLIGIIGGFTRRNLRGVLYKK